jgi:hypothetical protein
MKDASGNAAYGFRRGRAKSKNRATLTESHENNGQPQNNKSNVRNTESGKPREA